MNNLPEHLRSALASVFYAVVNKDSIELKELLDGLEKYEALMVCLGVTYMLTVKLNRPEWLNWLDEKISGWI